MSAQAAPRELYLKVRPPSGEAFDQEIDLEEIPIGRSRECALRLPDDSLSRRHAVLRRKGEEVYLEDLGSRNGSFLNGEPVSGTVRVEPGDRIQLGSSVIELRRRGPVRVAGERHGGMADATAIFDVTGLASGERRHLFSDLVEENRALSLLTRAGSLLITTRSLPETLSAVLDLCLEGFGAERAAVALLSGPDAEPDVAAARARGGDVDVRLSRTVARTVVQERKAVAVTDVEGDPRLASSESVRLQGVNSLMCAPLWDGNRVTGVLYVDRRFGHGNYNATDLKILSMLANVVAVRTENARLVEEALAAHRFEEELKVASRIQQRLLPASPPVVRGLDLHGICNACSEVGGDFFDYFVLPSGKVAMVIADVCGKGVSGALLAASLQAALRGGANVETRPTERLRWLNAFVHEHSPVDRYVTAAYVELASDGELAVMVAGHPPPLLLRADGTLVRLGKPGLPLGLFPDAEHAETHERFLPGDRLLLYTDGIVEAAPGGGREPCFGQERLVEAVASAPDSAQAACEAVFAALERFAPGPLRDDATVVVARRVQ